MTFRDFGVDEEEVKKVRAELRFAVNLGLITDDSLQGVESRNHCCIRRKQNCLWTKFIFQTGIYKI